MKITSIIVLAYILLISTPTWAIKAQNVQEGLEELKEIQSCLEWCQAVYNTVKFRGEETKNYGSDIFYPSITYLNPSRACRKLLIELGFMEQIMSFITKLEEKKRNLEIKEEMIFQKE